MNAQVETISPVKTKLSIEIPPEDVNKEETAALNELRRTVSVPGFRKGKAPLKALKRIYGGRVRSDVIGRLIEKTYIAALRENEIFPVADADIELQSGLEDEGISYTAVVEVRPKVEANAYADQTFKKIAVEVGEVDVEARMEKMREERASYEPAAEDHAAGQNDMVVMDYEGFIDSEPFEGGKGEDRPLVIGSGMFIPGFEEGLVGAKAGEERTVTVTFPEEYRAEELAGKEAEFKVQVKEIKTRSLPELDDDFAKEAAGAEGLEELRDQVRDQLGEEREAEAKRRLRQEMIDVLLNAHPFEVPESLVREQQSATTARFHQDLAARGMDPEALGLNDPKFHEAQRRGAERSVRWAFLMRAIADAEHIEVTDADVDERIEEIAREDGRPVSMIRGFFEQGDHIDSLRTSLLERRVLDRVEELGTLEEVDASEMSEGGSE